MQRAVWCVCTEILVAACLTTVSPAQTPLSWQQVKDKFEAANPTLRAGQIGIDELRSQETTAYLHPNPFVTSTLDQIDPFTRNPDRYRPFANALPFLSTSYLRERRHKRELRLESAQEGTSIGQSQYADLERNLLFNLRSIFVQTLQAKSVLSLTIENLDYFDKQLSIARDRFNAGDISHLDLDRLELQRVQFESDYETAQVNLRTVKIRLLMLMNDRTPVEQLDVTAPFDFSDQIAPLDDFRNIALAARPDLKATLQAIDKARTDNRLAIANGSTDPIVSFDLARNPPIPAYFGVSITIPLRIFDRNQGEKERTRLDIGRAQRLKDATQALVFSDVESAHAMLVSTVNLLRPYKGTYLPTATRVRDTISFAYQRGGASLVDFLDAQRNYRAVQLAYINLVGSYLTAAGQLNLAVGSEVIQ